MIFEDPFKKRWKRIVTCMVLIMCIVGMLLSMHLYAKETYPAMPSLAQTNSDDKNQLAKENKAGNSVSYSNKFSFNLNEKENVQNLVRTAFVLQSDSKSVNDLKNHINDLDVVFPDFFTFTGESSTIDENVDSSLLNFLKSSNVMVIPRIANIDSDGNWLGYTFTNFISKKENRNKLCSSIYQSLKKYNLKGINLDFEEIDPTSKVDYLDFLSELGSILHKNNLYLTIDLPINSEAFDYEYIGKVADKIVVMAYDEHYASGSNGPIASEDWFEDGVEEVLWKLPKNKTIIAMGQYSYDWELGKKTAAQSLSFYDTINLAKEMGAGIDTNEEAINSRFNYMDSNRIQHEVWMLDGISLWNELQFINKQGVYGVSLWRLGLEDPAIWKFYSQNNIENIKPSVLADVSDTEAVDYSGDGEFLKVQALPELGHRELILRGNKVDYAEYSTLPTGFNIERFGHNDNKYVTLTFDDGPSKDYTNKILDQLKKYKVKATFFVVGEQAKRFPDVLKREIDEGNVVGNHTYYHPNISTISEERLGKEIVSTEKVIEEITGKDTVLFRSPYDTDSGPQTAKELMPLYTAGKYGYTIVNSDIDSKDYEKPGVDQIVDSVVKQLDESHSNIILMHDAGGDRSQTVAAVSKLIPLLQQKGYKFVSINDLLGIPYKSIMPNAGAKEQILGWYDSVWDKDRNFGWTFIIILFFISTAFSIFRIMFLGIFVFADRKKRKVEDNYDFEPFVTILVPCYNEEKVIKKTLKGLLKSNYSKYEILVIDDGSEDNTRFIVKELSDKYDNIKLITKENGGKFSALNLGLEKAGAEYIITIDADTVILPDTVRNLMVPFKNPKVDAVCGNVRVGNARNLLTGFQTIEYITSQNYDRRAFAALNCISVVPGATGAWKKESVLKAGGYSDMTLTEDADLTLSMLEKGCKIVYASKAISITEAPERVKDLFKQRFRWSYGTYQSLWKHRKSFFKGTLGWIALPNMLLFQLILPILSPIGDIVFLLSIFQGNMKAVFGGYLLFLLMDFIGSGIAFLMDKAPLKYLLLILIQRFCYRQFMYIVTFKCIFAALRGRRHAWNKLKRTNSIKFEGLN